MLKKILSILIMLAMVLPLASCTMFRLQIPAESSTPAHSESVKDPQTEPSGANGTARPSTPSESGSEPVTEEIFITNPVRVPGDPLTVCIDPGHGYVDPGSTSDYLEGRWESEIVREYAETLKAKLETAGCRVIMLWDPDVYITADEIASAAKKAGVPFNADKLVDDRRFAAYNRSVWANVLHRETYIDVFVSLHVNTYPADESVKGTRIYCCGETDYSAKSLTLCKNLTQGLSSTLPNQKTRYYSDKAEDSFIVTKVPEMASALVEIGFATNRDEAKNIVDDSWADSFAEGLKDGIVAFGSRL